MWSTRLQYFWYMSSFQLHVLKHGPVNLLNGSVLAHMMFLVLSNLISFIYIYMYVCTFTYHIRHWEKTYAYPFVLPSIHPPILPSFHQLPHACVCKMVSKLERFPSLAESMTFEKEGLLLVCPYMYLLYILCMWCDGKSEQNWPSASFSRKYPETLQWN